ncbi:LamB/YcsF family protein [Terrihabitans sp. B22-R8]|uniref:LamB/YcsF family protein n=1 Tax=Terrihabitans sp. B22-R8 TaxID=3425128 RepID=UPI00403CECCE
MAFRIDINADLGEGFSADEALLGLVSSANIACGFHAGDLETMRLVSRVAGEQGVGIGAHPSFDDLPGFGRNFIRMSAWELESLVAYQIGMMAEAAADSGNRLSHVKVHGALYNTAAEDEAHALTVGRAIKAVDPGLIYLGLAGSCMANAAGRLGLAFAHEAFADRHYDDQGRLLPRTVPGSVLSDPELVTERVKRMLQDGEVRSMSGARLNVSFDSLCVHGDEPTAMVVARAVRRAVEDEGWEVVPLSQLMAGEQPAAPALPGKDADRISA